MLLEVWCQKVGWSEARRSVAKTARRNCQLQTQSFLNGTAQIRGYREVEIRRERRVSPFGKKNENIDYVEAENAPEERRVAPNRRATLSVHVVASPASHGALEGGGPSVRSFQLSNSLWRCSTPACVASQTTQPLAAETTQPNAPTGCGCRSRGRPGSGCCRP